MFFYDDIDNVPISFSIEELQINDNERDINTIEQTIYNKQQNNASNDSSNELNNILNNNEKIIHSTEFYFPQLNMTDNENNIFFNDYNKYTLKELFKICDYYGFAKELKTNKCNKKEIIQYLNDFENDYNNVEIVYTRRNMWFYMDELKNDPFMKKLIIW